MKKYSSYKSSGIEWIGDIPETWDSGKMKYVLSNNDGGVWGSDVENEDEGNIVIRSTEITIDGNWDFSNPLKRVLTENEIIKSKLYEGDIVITKSSGSPQHIGKSVIVSKEIELLNCCYSNFVQRIRFRNYNPKLYHFVLNSDIGRSQFKYLTTSSTGLGNLNGSSLNDVLLPFIPLQEQEQIVNYLDDKTTIIDKLISTKQRKVELLKEQRTTLINQVITKGLNPNVKMKDSGVEWIGEIPESWIVSKLKYDTTKPVQYGLNISGDNYKEEGIRFIRITDISENGELIEENGKYLEKINVPDEFLLNKFDVLFCRSGHTVGKSYLHLLEGEYTTGGYLVRFNFDNYSNSKFIFYLSKTNFYWDWIKLNSVVSTIENVNGDKYQNFIYPKPTNGEQQKIVEYLDKQTKEIDDLVSMEQNKIELLKEYRQSLISEVITGKIKVV